VILSEEKYQSLIDIKVVKKSMIYSKRSFISMQ